MKRTIKQFAHVWDSHRDEEMPDIMLCDEDRKVGYWICLGEVEVTFDCPPMPSETELTNRKIDFLQNGRKEVVQEFTTKLANIDQQMEELRALTFDGDS